MHVAAQNGFLEVAVALLDAHADADVKNEDEESPLHLAAKEGRNRWCNWSLASVLLLSDIYQSGSPRSS